MRTRQGFPGFPRLDRAARRARSGSARPPARPTRCRSSRSSRRETVARPEEPNVRSKSSLSAPAPSDARTGRPPGPSTRSTTASAPVRAAASTTSASTRASKSSVSGCRRSLRASTMRATACSTLVEIASRWLPIRSRTSSEPPFRFLSGSPQGEQCQAAGSQHSTHRDKRSHHRSSSTSSPRALYSGRSPLGYGRVRSRSATMPRLVGRHGLPAFALYRKPSTCSRSQRVPTVNQLVRKGRTTPKVEDEDPGTAGSAAEARRLHARLHDHAEEAELRAAQGRARPAHERHRGRRLHPRRGAQPAGALGRPRTRRPREGPPGLPLQGHPRWARLRRRHGAPPGALEVRREEGVGADATPRRDPATPDRGRRRSRLGARRAAHQPPDAGREEVRSPSARSTTRSRSRRRRPVSRSSRCSSRL